MPVSPANKARRLLEVRALAIAAQCGDRERVEIERRAESAERPDHPGCPEVQRQSARTAATSSSSGCAGQTLPSRAASASATTAAIAARTRALVPRRHARTAQSTFASVRDRIRALRQELAKPREHSRVVVGFPACDPADRARVVEEARAVEHVVVRHRRLVRLAERAARDQVAPGRRVVERRSLAPQLAQVGEVIRRERVRPALVGPVPHEGENAAGTQHARDLGDRAVVVEPVKCLRREHGVHRSIVERDPLRAAE